jgi:hypothetical protein
MSEPLNDAIGKHVTRPSKSSRAVTRLAWRTLIAVLPLLLFVEVFGAFNVQHVYFIHHSQARQRLLWLGQQIASFRTYHGELPRSLADLYVPLSEEVIPMDRHDWNSYAHFGYDGRFDAEGQPFDPWGVPYHYEVKDTAFELYSAGADGTPGGSGINLDLKIDDPPVTTNSPTIGQLLWDKPKGRGAVALVMLVLSSGMTLLLHFAARSRRNRQSGVPAPRNLFAHFVQATMAVLVMMILLIVFVMPLAWAQDSWYYLRPDPPPYVASQ